jgi:serpin B
MMRDHTARRGNRMTPARNIPPGAIIREEIAARGWMQEDLARIMEGNQTFALSLFSRMEDPGKNLFFSPFSISTALAMTWAGARHATEAQMGAVLGFTQGQNRTHPAFEKLLARLDTGPDNEACRLLMANALWGQIGFKLLAPFKQQTLDHYHAGLNPLDFVGDPLTARKTINQWVKEKTGGKIEELIQPGSLNPATRLVLTNAIYFKGRWKTCFDKKKTEQAPFHLLNGETAEVSMMRIKGDYPYMEGDGFQALELPYEEDALSMVVFLPSAGPALGDLEKNCTPENLAAWCGGLRTMEVEVHLPRFKITHDLDLAAMLESMGMKDAFSANLADFSGMTGDQSLFLSNVIHKAFVEVNEEGTEAAAATGAVMSLTMVKEKKVFLADHPFLFFIRDRESGSILFMGRFAVPGAQE